MSRKEKFALYLTPEKKAILEKRYQEDGSRSITGDRRKFCVIDVLRQYENLRLSQE